jgi:hypothetical protein
MHFRNAALAIAPVLTLSMAHPIHAQGRIAVTPMVGAYIAGEDVQDLRTSGEQITIEKEATLGLGLAVEFGWLRGSVAYASGATINETGETEGEIGEGNVLAIAGDVVIRPLPRLIVVQPYLLGGLGLKRTDYNFDDEGVTDAFDDDSDLTLHLGVGADIMLGGIGIVAEVSDFISQRGDEEFGRHDAFAMLGIKLALF